MECGPRLLSPFLPLPSLPSFLLLGTTWHSNVSCLHVPGEHKFYEVSDSCLLDLPAYPQCLELFTMHMALVCICSGWMDD